MNNLQYIEAHEIENVASQYQNEGYQVRVSPLELSEAFETRPIGYPVMATKCCRKVAFAVVDRTKLTEESKQLDTLREQADKEGFYDFLLGILSVPPHTEGEIEGLNQELFDYLVVNELDHLAELPAKIQPLSVGQIGFDSISIMDLGVKAVGNGVLEVKVENGAAFGEQFGFPLSFDVELDHNLRLKHVHDIVAQTAGFYNSRPPTTAGA
ncbi:MAG: hypothetical protein ACPGWR_21170 [Ardenticatenaceae bacterium]